VHLASLLVKGKAVADTAVIYEKENCLPYEPITTSVPRRASTVTGGAQRSEQYLDCAQQAVQSKVGSS
jgi:hypothetical protein